MNVLYKSFFKEEKSDVKKEFFYQLFDNTKIYVVDGNLVRDLYDEDFLKGGHGYVYDYIPKEEIWIEKDVILDNEPELLAHEMFEKHLMKHDNKTYEEAHFRAEHFEQALRLVQLFQNASIKTNKGENNEV